MHLAQQRRNRQQPLDCAAAKRPERFASIEVDRIGLARLRRIEKGEPSGQALAIVDLVAPASDRDVVRQAVKDRNGRCAGPLRLEVLRNPCHLVALPIALAIDGEAFSGDVPGADATAMPLDEPRAGRLCRGPVRHKGKKVHRNDLVQEVHHVRGRRAVVAGVQEHRHRTCGQGVVTRRTIDQPGP